MVKRLRENDKLQSGGIQKPTDTTPDAAPVEHGSPGGLRTPAALVSKSVGRTGQAMSYPRLDAHHPPQVHSTSGAAVADRPEESTQESSDQLLSVTQANNNGKTNYGKALRKMAISAAEVSMHGWLPTPKQTSSREETDAAREEVHHSEQCQAWGRQMGQTSL